MKNLPQISEAEFEVMKIVWKYAPISTRDITEKLLQTTNWSPKTIQTLIKRLVTKGALTYEKQSRMFIYTPAVKENEYIGQEKRGTHLRKTKPYVYLHSGSKRKRIYWTGKQFFSKTLLQWGYYSYGFCIYRK